MNSSSNVVLEALRLAAISPAPSSLSASGLFMCAYIVFAYVQFHSLFSLKFSFNILVHFMKKNCIQEVDCFGIASHKSSWKFFNFGWCFYAREHQIYFGSLTVCFIVHVTLLLIFSLIIRV